MATLKISDLSVGDWVEFKGKPSKVLECGIIIVSPKTLEFKPRLILSEKSDIYDCVDVDKVSSIPITAEILEKNGFVKRDTDYPIYEYTTLLGKMLRTTIVSLHNPYDYIFCRIEDITKELHEDGRCLVSSSVNRHPIFVHDLQHALRLAGIDKELNL